MATGEARIRQKLDPRPVVFLDKWGRPRWHFIFENNPRISRDGAGQLSHNRGGNRPYIRRVTPERFYWVEKYDCPRGEIYLNTAERQFAHQYARSLIIEPNLKAHATRNKDWGFERWQAVVDALPHLPWAQVGPPGTRQLRGVPLIPTHHFREAAAVLWRAIGYVGHEGALHHAAAAFEKRAVVVFGGFISPRQTGYAFHTNLVGSDEPCGFREPCAHCREAMNRITPDQVVEAVKGITA